MGSVVSLGHNEDQRYLPNSYTHLAPVIRSKSSFTIFNRSHLGCVPLRGGIITPDEADPHILDHKPSSTNWNVI
jgi:hypothetical protein